jgi:hypothetical protein
MTKEQIRFEILVKPLGDHMVALMPNPNPGQEADVLQLASVIGGAFVSPEVREKFQALVSAVITCGLQTAHPDTEFEDGESVMEEMKQH